MQERIHGEDSMKATALQRQDEEKFSLLRVIKCLKQLLAHFEYNIVISDSFHQRLSTRFSPTLETEHSLVWSLLEW